MLFHLHPQQLDEGGLPAAVPEPVRHVASDAGIECVTDVHTGRYPSWVERLAYRAIREAVINVGRHAKASRVEVVLAQHGNDLHACVVDDGRGFDRAAVPAGNPLHFGLDATSKRIEAAGGRFEVGSVAGSEPRFALRFPSLARDGPRRPQSDSLVDRWWTDPPLHCAIVVLDTTRIRAVVAVDHPAVLDSASRVLSADGIDIVVRAVDGGSAVRESWPHSRRLPSST
jgi:hypothetical protein